MAHGAGNDESKGVNWSKQLGMKLFQDFSERSTKASAVYPTPTSTMGSWKIPRPIQDPDRYRAFLEIPRTGRPVKRSIALSDASALKRFRFSPRTARCISGIGEKAHRLPQGGRAAPPDDNDSPDGESPPPDSTDESMRQSSATMHLDLKP
jgi:hypothetical protein